MAIERTESVSREGMYYNALALESRSNYVRLATAYERWGSWENAWHNRTGSLFPVSPQAELEKMAQAAVSLVLKNEAAYPPLLKEMASPPLGIYYRGGISQAVEKTAPAVAIVGTRRATPEGKRIAERFAGSLARRGCVIVSGLAFGIDAAAHRGTLAASGTTVAVLAHGLHTIHPGSNAKLGQEILDSGGALISEYPLGMPALKTNFVARNRIVSGLTKAVFIIEAPFGSGALRTARFAMEQNRDVLVMPGPIDHPNFKGSHQLIRDGAILIASLDHALEALSIPAEASKESARSSPLLPVAFPGENNEDATIILRTLADAPEALTIDKISEVTNLKVQRVLQIITLLTLEAFIEETPRGIRLHRNL